MTSKLKEFTALGYPSHVLNGAIGRTFARTKDERLLRARICSFALVKARRAKKDKAARCGWLCACLVVCGGRATRPTGSSAAQGASMPMRAACGASARLARMFPCDEGRAYVFTLRARAGAEGGAVSPRSDVGWSSA